MKAFAEDGLLDNVNARGKQLREGLEAMKDTGVVKEVRGWGLILGLELTEECGFLAGDVVGKLTEAGMLTVPAGLRVVRFVPPLVVTEQEIADALAMVGDTLKALKK